MRTGSDEEHRTSVNNVSFCVKEIQGKKDMKQGQFELMYKAPVMSVRWSNLKVVKCRANQHGAAMG
ncbi:hypothetical protein N7486_010421 [Penicillium sp. IBT 16267x]|nr:hypothetical protein N7486_010421 [Penicillium sp. IBT 16267x]